MGESLSKNFSTELNICKKNRVDLVEPANIPLYTQVFKHFELASPTVRQSLISMVIPTILEIYPNGEELNVLIQEYFYNPLSIQTNLILYISKENNEVVAFSIYYIFENYFIENDFSPENKYFVSTLFGCAKEKVRRVGIRKENFKIKAALDMEDYSDCNFVHFEVSNHPMSYYGLCQVSNYVFPSYNNREVPKKVEEFIRRIVGLLEYDRHEDDPFLVKEYFNDVGFDREFWMKIYNKLSNDAKFFIDKTKLEKNIGLAFVAAYKLLENNTLGIKGGRYVIDEKLKIELQEVDFKSPKI